jgi:hypothetical protein
MDRPKPSPTIDDILLLLPRRLRSRNIANTLELLNKEHRNTNQLPLVDRHDLRNNADLLDRRSINAKEIEPKIARAKVRERHNGCIQSWRQSCWCCSIRSELLGEHAPGLLPML